MNVNKCQHCDALPAIKTFHGNRVGCGNKKSAFRNYSDTFPIFPPSIFSTIETPPRVSLRSHELARRKSTPELQLAINGARCTVPSRKPIAPFRRTKRRRRNALSLIAPYAAGADRACDCVTGAVLANCRARHALLPPVVGNPVVGISLWRTDFHTNICIR